MHAIRFFYLNCNSTRVFLHRVTRFFFGRESKPTIYQKIKLTYDFYDFLVKNLNFGGIPDPLDPLLPTCYVPDQISNTHRWTVKFGFISIQNTTRYWNGSDALLYLTYTLWPMCVRSVSEETFWSLNYIKNTVARKCWLNSGRKRPRRTLVGAVIICKVYVNRNQQTNPLPSLYLSRGLTRCRRIYTKDLSCIVGTYVFFDTLKFTTSMLWPDKLSFTTKIKLNSYITF